MERYFCRDEERRALVRASALNGIDFLEVLDSEAPPALRQLLLVVRCFKPLPAGLTEAKVRVEGGVRVRPVRVVWARPFPEVAAAPGIPALEKAFLAARFGGDPEGDALLVVHTDSTGDFSPYRLVLDLGAGDGFDPRLSAVELSFKVECPSDFDCREEEGCPPAALAEPEISYLAKDYASFRRLMFDRLSAIAPGWKERNPADVGVALVELMAFVGDQLSYYQDAVATEAYLGTARLRTSVRRHARLVDYEMHEGTNARAWVVVQAGPAADGGVLPKGTRLLTRFVAEVTVLSLEDFEKAVALGVPVFETMRDLTLRSAHHEIHLYAWGDRECCLPAGATAATLKGPLPNLAEGDLLLFEEVLGPQTGFFGDADPLHRHVVRLTKAEAGEDPLNGQEVVEIAWDAADALPFPLCLSATTDGVHGAAYAENVSVARGNLVPADHGLTVPGTGAGELLGPVPEEGLFRPLLAEGPLTHAAPLPEDFDTRPAALLMDHRPAAAEPAVRLEDPAAGEPWEPRRDLLSSDRFAAEFVVEMEESGRARLRFGDDENGRRPADGTTFAARYRVGHGAAGNLGAGKLVHAVTPLPLLAVRNPLAARGGSDPEDLEEVRRFAPQAFRVQQRAVTEADYAEVAELHPEVQKAAATFRWTGSWYTVFVTVDRRGGLAVDAAFERDLRNHLNFFRMAGCDLEVDGPRFVALDLALSVCVAPGYFRGHVKAALLERLSNRVLSDGSLGFFHPDNWTFGQPLYLSRLYAAASAVEGVESVEVVRFRRRGRPEGTAKDDGFLPMDRLEIARLDNDRNFQENGRLELLMGGGR